MNFMWRRVFPICALAVLAATLWSLVRPRSVFSDEDDAENAVKVRSFVRMVNGHAIISLDTKTQALMGLETARLEAAAARRSVTAIAVVLPVSSLVTLRQGMIAARLQLERGRIALAASRKEFERLKKLYAENQNASEKSVEVAQAAVEADQADVRNAEEQVALARAQVTDRWGNLVAKWMTGNSPALGRILTRKDVLIQLTLPFGKNIRPPRRLELQIPGSQVIEATFLSPYPQLDPRILGPSYLYRAQARPSLVPGLTLSVRLPAGPRLKGVLVPRSAEVWWRGKPWVYVETAAGKFSRQPVPENLTEERGGFLVPGIEPGEQVVTRGAMILLSEEFRARIASAEEG